MSGLRGMRRSGLESERYEWATRNRNDGLVNLGGEEESEPKTQTRVFVTRTGLRLRLCTRKWAKESVMNR